MIKNKILFILFILFIPLVQAIDFCDSEVDANTACQLTTPEISCSSYTLDIYDGDLNIYKSDESMSQINGGFYNYTFNEPTGNYLIVLCDNSSTDIIVRETIHTKLDNIDIELISVNDTVKSEASAMIAHGDSAWSAVGNTTVNVNETAIALAVWDTNLSEIYPQADDDNFIAHLAGEKVLQALRFIIQFLFG